MALAFAGLGFFFALGVKGLGGVFEHSPQNVILTGGFRHGGIPEFPDPTGRIYGRRPYEKIGRCVFAWGRFEQDVISQYRTYGFPVTRLESRRLQEGRSRGLLTGFGMTGQTFIGNTRQIALILKLISSR